MVRHYPCRHWKTQENCSIVPGVFRIFFFLFGQYLWLVHLHMPNHRHFPVVCVDKATYGTWAIPP